MTDKVVPSTLYTTEAEASKKKAEADKSVEDPTPSEGLKILAANEKK